PVQAQDIASVQQQLDAIEAPAVTVPVTVTEVGIEQTQKDIASVQQDLAGLAAPTLIVPGTETGIEQVEKQLEALRSQAGSIPVQTSAAQAASQLGGLQNAVVAVGRQVALMGTAVAGLARTLQAGLAVSLAQTGASIAGVLSLLQQLGAAQAQTLRLA